MLVYIDILVYAYAVINRDDLVRGVNTRSLLTDFGCNRRMCEVPHKVGEGKAHTCLH